MSRGEGANCFSPPPPPMEESQLRNVYLILISTSTRRLKIRADV